MAIIFQCDVCGRQKELDTRLVPEAIGGDDRDMKRPAGWEVRGNATDTALAHLCSCHCRRKWDCQAVGETLCLTQVYGNG